MQAPAGVVSSPAPTPTRAAHITRDPTSPRPLDIGAYRAAENFLSAVDAGPQRLQGRWSPTGLKPSTTAAVVGDYQEVRGRCQHDPRPRKQIERARPPIDAPTETPAPLPRNTNPPDGTVSENGTIGNAGGPLDLARRHQADRPEPMWSRRLIRWVTTAAVIVVAACAARSSYDHQRLVVEMAGNHKAPGTSHCRSTA